MSKKIAHEKIRTGGSRISWNPEVDPVTEERLALFAKSDLENWNRLMRIIFMNRRESVTFSKRKIKWT
jgi:hypothetical protein